MNKIRIGILGTSTTDYVDTCKLIDIAKNKNLAIHENYMFMFHNQIKKYMKY